MKRLAIAIATSGGLGYAPIAPGTFGSAAGVVIYLLTSHWPVGAQIGIAALVTVVGVWASSEAAVHFGRSDPSQVVIDEVAGQLVTYLGTGVGWKGALVGFFLFRGLDIVKPWPANRLESLHGGLGIVADDVMAALYGCAMLHLFVWLVPSMR
jgi:phosphatidylglycerophosphatase A